jgi:hypothetical protein
MKRRSQRSRQMIPTAGVIETAVNQDQRRRRRVTPIREMKSKPLRPILAPLGSDQCCVHGAYLKPSLAQVQRRAAGRQVRSWDTITPAAAGKALAAAMPIPARPVGRRPIAERPNEFLATRS